MTASGVPWPEVPHFGQGGAFPCQGHRCGCSSAEQCWKSCCCFSRDEKLAWAKQNNVTPPAIAQASSCCSSQLTKTTTPVPTKSKSSCCSDETETRETNWVLAVRAQKCRGAATEWLSLGAVLAGVEYYTTSLVLVCGEQIALCDEHAHVVADRPDAPPPKAAL